MIEALKDRTYMVRHNPNCPKRFEVRLTGAALLAAFSSVKMRYGDAVGYGDTAEEAAANALAAMSPQVRAETASCTCHFTGGTCPVCSIIPKEGQI